MKEKCYFLVKDFNKEKELIIIDYEKTVGFRVKPRNRVKYDGITVNQMVIIKPSFIEKVLKRKIQRKLDLYLQFIVSLLDDTDESSNPTSLDSALDDLSRYRSVVDGNYRRFLDAKYIDLLLKKIALLEQEIKKRLVAIQMRQYQNNLNNKVEEQEKARKAR